MKALLVIHSLTKALIAAQLELRVGLKEEDREKQKQMGRVPSDGDRKAAVPTTRRRLSPLTGQGLLSVSPLPI